MIATRAKRKPVIEAGDWQPTQADIDYCTRKYPTVDVAETAELFLLSAESAGRLYASWSAAFKKWVRDDNGYGGVVHIKGLEAPGAREVLLEARELGFRAKYAMETIEQYKTALRQYEPPVQGEMGNLISGLFEGNR